MFSVDPWVLEKAESEMPEHELTPRPTGLVWECLLNPGDTTQGKKLKVIDYHYMSADVRLGREEATNTAWEKHKGYHAVLPCERVQSSRLTKTSVSDRRQLHRLQRSQPIKVHLCAV